LAATMRLMPGRTASGTSLAGSGSFKNAISILFVPQERKTFFFEKKKQKTFAF
jgi:hypothetical protein